MKSLSRPNFPVAFFSGQIGISPQNKWRRVSLAFKNSFEIYEKHSAV